MSGGRFCIARRTGSSWPPRCRKVIPANGRGSAGIRGDAASGLRYTSQHGRAGRARGTCLADEREPAAFRLAHGAGGDRGADRDRDSVSPGAARP